MAAAFRPVNTPLTAEIPRQDMMPPKKSSPRPSTAPQSQLQPPPSSDDGKTPTRASFNSVNMTGQRPLLTSPFPQLPSTAEPTDNALPHDVSQRSTKSPKRNSLDVDMDDSDGETGTVEDGAGSDAESLNADGSRSNKKKKSQRFYCTDYPPCNLSFTRSEHLARHIRKHTGERPFQCHCSRRFSRLDNLRQHAQTVHVNEDIPIDSLAATGSRFQRQIRTDRVRQAGNRARASTGGSAGGPVRGHSKSLSTSSISSITSVGSAYSAQNDPRRRPPPLVMAADPRSRLSLESYPSGTDSTFSYRPQSPGDFSAPTSATFSTAQSSPRWSSSVVSPSPSHSRSQSMYAMGTRTPGRRLSVPSGASPFQLGPGGQMPGRSAVGSMLVNSSNSGAFPPPNASLLSSPTVSTAGFTARRDSMASTSDEAWRRRTWHPDSRSFGGTAQLNAALSQSVRPNPPPPIANPSNPQPNLRLPGIESFDPLPRSATPPRRNASPMAVDSEISLRPPVMEAIQADERRNLNMYDVSLQRGLGRLDIGHKTPPRDSAGMWASEVHKAVQSQVDQSRQNPPTVRFEEQPRPSHHVPPSPAAGRSFHQHTMSAPALASVREGKGHGWYQGPVAAAHGNAHQSPQDVRSPHVDRMVHPNFNGFAGFPAREQLQEPQQQQRQQRQQQSNYHQQQPPLQQQPQQQFLHHQQQQQRPQQDRSNNPDSLRRLEALVAVATSEGSTAAAY
ncbi:c2h2 transcription factor [Trichoderma cornu-damae]|uniref:C2h2 transcription factor n=1 Tax=Trichoderma cornu-damae TaxID=654480 RepID=A0A9P8TYX0_9HYPO|nr:c2h2 transcription factor [Trichoderma cornu-damae]